MYNPRSNKDTDKEIKPAPYADAAVNDEGLTSTEDEETYSEEEEDMNEDDDFAEADAIEEIEIEDIDDLDERVHYSSLRHSSCVRDDLFSLWPNPVHDKLFINVVANNESKATIKLLDNKGAIIKIQTAKIREGSNQQIWIVQLIMQNR